VNALIAGGSLV